MRRVHLLADAQPLARDQRRQHPVGEHDAAHLIRHAARDPERLHLGLADGLHDSRTRQAQVVEGGLGAVRPLGTVARGTGVDQLRVVFTQNRVVQAQAARDPLAEVLHEYVCFHHQPVNDLACFGLAQIQRDALLVAVACLEVEVGPIAPAYAGHSKNATPRVAALALLELDHLGPEIAQHR